MTEISEEILSILTVIAEEENFSKFKIKHSDGAEKGDGFLRDIIRVQIIGEKKYKHEKNYC